MRTEESLYGTSGIGRSEISTLATSSARAPVLNIKSHGI